MESGYFARPEDWKEPPHEAFSPHIVLFVGYDSTSFYYYETHGKDFVLTGERGIRIDESSVADAVQSFSSRYRLPWRYMFSVFLEGNRTIRLDEILHRNGEEMVGRVLGPTSTGSYAIRQLADGVKREGARMLRSPRREHFASTLKDPDRDPERQLHLSAADLPRQAGRSGGVGPPAIRRRELPRRPVDLRAR